MTTQRHARFAAAFLSLFLAVPAVAETISIRADEWLPYNGANNLRPAGYMIEMAQAIAKANGHEIDYRTLPWDAALADTRKGVYDCVVGATKAEAGDFVFPEYSWGGSTAEIYALAESPWRYTGIDSLKSVRFGVIPKYSLSGEVDAYVAMHRDDPQRVVMVETSGRAAMGAVSRLVRGTIDVYAEDPNVMEQTLAKLDLKDRVVSRGVIGVAEPVFIACTPEHPRGAAYAKMFSEGTEVLRKSGELAKILSTYGLTDWANN